MNWVPDACTLPTAERPFRVAEFEALFASARSISRPDRQTLEVVLTAPRSEVVDLTTRESECCSFFTFDLIDLDDGVRLRIGVRPAYAAVLDGLS
ncbi:hypothetical protein AB0E69_19425 [Kribbella sp. NPDC026611]|uniref:hypothetical protein n=1 Tax=Kribbella sp. NPDC026611 TaxID=3154911 RepID=UPI0033DCB4FD